MIKHLLDLPRWVFAVIGFYAILAGIHYTDITRDHFVFWTIAHQAFTTLCICWRVRHTSEPYLWLAVLYVMNFLTVFWVLITTVQIDHLGAKVACIVCSAGIMIALVLGHGSIGFISIRQLLISITPILSLIIGYSAIRLFINYDHSYQHQINITFNLLFISIMVFSFDRRVSFRQVNVVLLLLQFASSVLCLASMIGVVPLATFDRYEETMLATNPGGSLAISAIANIFVLIAVFHNDNNYIDDYLSRINANEHSGISSYLNYLFLSIWLLFIGNGFDNFENRTIAFSGLIASIIVLWQFRVYRSNLLITNSKLTDLANSDSLTGVLNRQGLERKWREFEVNDVTVLFVDLDKFKPINDTHGHNIGDKVLQTIGSRLVESVRETDLVCRWGGDEFVVLCPELDWDRGQRMSRRLKSRISDPMHIEAGPTITMEASIGLATANTQKDLTSSLQDADKDMLQKKKEGQNNQAKPNEQLLR